MKYYAIKARRKNMLCTETEDYIRFYYMDSNIWGSPIYASFKRYVKIFTPSAQIVELSRDEFKIQLMICELER